MDTGEWLRAYAMLALRVDRRLDWVSLDYFGPDAWREQVEAEEPPPPGRLVEDAEHLLAEIPGLIHDSRDPVAPAGPVSSGGNQSAIDPGHLGSRPVHRFGETIEPVWPVSSGGDQFGHPDSWHTPVDARRATFLTAQARALRALAGRANGERPPLPELVREVLGLAVEPLPESVFEQAHAELDRALPPGPGSLTDRLRAWEARHSLPDNRMLPPLVDLAVAECRTRTSAMIVELPDGERVDCELVSGVSYRGVAWYRGGLRSTILLGGDRPFNLADLLYVVAHEGHPGHIAELVLKEIHLADRPEERVRFLPSPPFVLSEGLGLHAEEIVFPSDEAQAWLTDNILTPQGIRPDGSDFAAIHRAQTALFGAQANAALLAAEGRPHTEVAEYLSRWALRPPDSAAATAEHFATPGGYPYIFAYHHGWRLLRDWFDAAPAPTRLVRRLLTEQLLPADLEQPSD